MYERALRTALYDYHPVSPVGREGQDPPVLFSEFNPTLIDGDVLWSKCVHSNRERDGPSTVR